MPGISAPSTVIPQWNVRPEKYVDTIFEFAELYLHDDAAILLFHANDRDILFDVEECAISYSFRLAHDWWAINDLPLALPRDSTSTVFPLLKQCYVSWFFYYFCDFFLGLVLLYSVLSILQCTRFWVQLFVRDSPIKSRFSIGGEIGDLDTFYNTVTAATQLMHDGVPWRGAREKSSDFLKTFIEALSKVGDIVLDWKASTG